MSRTTLGHDRHAPRGGGHKLMFLEPNGGWRRRIVLHFPQRRKDRASFIKGGYLQRHSDLLTILSVVAIMVVVGFRDLLPGRKHPRTNASQDLRRAGFHDLALPWHHHRPQRLALSGLTRWPTVLLAPIRRARGWSTIISRVPLVPDVPDRSA